MVSEKSASVWSLKPWWCQPWSILLTGFGLITASWLVFHQWWLTGLVALPLGLWMGYFLLVFPRLFEQAQMTQHDAETEKSV